MRSARAIALSAALLASTAGRAQGPVLPRRDPLEELAPGSPGRDALERLFPVAAGPAGEVTFRGLIAEADRAAERTAAASLSARERRVALGLALRNEVDRSVALALEMHSLAITQTREALAGAAEEPIRLLVVCRAAELLTGSLPTRADLEPIAPDNARKLDQATASLRSLIVDVLCAGRAMRARLIGDGEPAAGSPEAARRDAARELAATALAVGAARRDSLADRIAKDPALAAYHDWLRQAAAGRLPGPSRPVAVERAGGPRGSGPAAPVFRVGDVRNLVPWPCALAEDLCLGRIELAWKIVGLEPVDARPETTTSYPRLIVEARFRLSGQSDVVLPVYTLHLRGRPVDRFTLGDEAGYRDALKKALAATSGLAPEVLALADLPSIAEARLKLAETPGARALEAVDRRLQLSLGENELTHALAERTWGDGRLERDVYWLVRLPALLGQSPRPDSIAAPPAPAPSTTPPAPATPPPAPAPPPDPADVWLDRLGVESRVADLRELEIDVSPITDLVRSHLLSALRRQAAEARRGDEPSRRDLAAAEGKLLQHRGPGSGELRPQPGTFDFLIDRDWEAAVLAEERAIREPLPVWLDAAYRFRPTPIRDEAARPRGGPARLVERVVALWNAGEALLDDREELEREHPGWPQWLLAMRRLEAAGSDLFGEDLAREIAEPDPTASAVLRYPSLTGWPRLRPAAGTLGRFAAASSLPAQSALCDELAGPLAADIDRLRLVALALGEALWIRQTLDLSTPAAWPEHFARSLVNGSEPPPAAPALPPDFAATPRARCERDLSLLLAAAAGWIGELRQADPLAEVERLRAGVARIETARFPGGGASGSPLASLRERLEHLWDGARLRGRAIAHADELLEGLRQPQLPPDTATLLASLRVLAFEVPPPPSCPVEPWLERCRKVAWSDPSLAERAKAEAAAWEAARSGAVAQPPGGAAEPLPSPADSPDALLRSELLAALGGYLLERTRLEFAGIEPALAAESAIALRRSPPPPADATEEIRRGLRRLGASAGLVLDPSRDNRFLVARPVLDPPED
jgi:hypothetical protein